MASGRALGEASPPFAPPSVSDIYRALAAQVNRFGPGAPAGYQFAQKVFPLVVSRLDADLALTAILIYQRRATDAFNQFGDEGSAQAIAKANTGFADPVGFVSGNLAEVTQAVANFADSLGLPAPVTLTTGPVAATGLNSTTLLLGAGILAALWMVTR